MRAGGGEEGQRRIVGGKEDEFGEVEEDVARIRDEGEEDFGGFELLVDELFIGDSGIGGR